MNLEAALSCIPHALSKALRREFAELSVRFARRDWGPAELHGGRLAEGLFRYLEWKRTGAYTPLNSPLRRAALVRDIEQDPSVVESLRFHVRRCAELMMDVRNKRDVAHLGDDVAVDEMDAHLVMRLASWALAEIVRVEGQVSAEEAQIIIDRLSSTHIPLVEEIDGDLVLLEKGGRAADRALTVLYHAYPEPLDIDELRSVVVYQNSTNFRRLLRREAQKGLVHLKDGRAFLTGKGAMWVENNVELQLMVT